MSYKDIDKPEVIPGLKIWKNPKNQFNVAMLHYTADPDKDPNRNGKEWYENERKGTPKATWIKEYEIDFTTKSGKLIYGPEYSDFDPKIHLIDSFELPEPYELLISLDFGQRNPTCALVGAWTKDNVLYIIDEYYKPALPSKSSREMFKEFAYLTGVPDLETRPLSERRTIAINTFPIRVIDPTTKAKNRSKIKDGEEIVYSVQEEFYDHGWDFELGVNDVNAGITRVREYMKVDSEGKTHLYIFKDKCPYLTWEIQRYRYKEYTEIQEKTRNMSEEPVKKNDHAMDALRMMIMTRPNTPEIAEKPKTRIQRDIEKLLQPKIMDHAWDRD